MKTSLLAILVCCSLSISAKNYYFSSVTGNDSRTTTEAQNSATPWKTITKLNSFFSSILPGDSILFARGSSFYGAITVQKSGTSVKRIVFDAYGSGALPVITGFSSISSWKSLGNNLWESSSAVSKISSARVVLVNGTAKAMGRYPNTGYLPYQTYTSNTSITSSSVNSAGTNWTGAEAVIKKTKWVIDRKAITAHSGGKLTYSGGGYTGTNNYGFFIQNDLRTLDQQNEWYYNRSTKKLTIYSAAAPVKVQVSTVDTLVFMAYYDYITFNNISFTGANTTAFWIGSCNYLSLKGCNVAFSENGITGKNFGTPSTKFSLQNSTFDRMNNNAVNLSEEFTSANISSNKFKNTAVVAGAGGSGDGTYTAISLRSANCIIRYNTIDTVGYNGITFFGNSITVSYNKINTFCTLKSDGGGIYTQGINTNMIISFNTVINGIGNVDGVYNPAGVRVIGIYCDGSVSDIHLLNNSIANVNNGGIYLHNPRNIEVRNNTVYNANATALLIKNDSNNILMRNLTITNNIFFGKEASQITSQIITLHNDISSLGVIDSNYYARPINDNTVIGAQPFGEDVNSTYYTVPQWKTYSHLDAHSLQSPKTVSTTNDLRFEYNSGSSSKVVNLGANYIDVKGKVYAGTITLAPYSSAVLIKSGATVAVTPTQRPGQLNVITEQKLGAYPNPFKDFVTIQTASVVAGAATVDVFNLDGTHIRRVFNGVMAAGITRNFAFDAKSLPAGIYIVRFTTTNGVLSERITLAK